MKNKKTLKHLVLALSVMVVFVTTYLLILPAFTLDETEALRQGGIDLVSEETALDSNVSESDTDENIDESELDKASVSPLDSKEGTKISDSDPDIEKPNSDSHDNNMITESTELTAEGKGFTVTATVDEKAEVPEGTVLKAEKLSKSSEDYQNYYEEAVNAVSKEFKDGKVRKVELYNITLVSDGNEIEPVSDATVNVRIAYDKGIKVTPNDDLNIVHMGSDDTKVFDTSENNIETKVEDSRITEASFDTDSFSIYAVVIIENEEGTLTFEDDGIKVTITYTKEANIPVGTELTVKELDKDSKEYNKHLDEAWQKLNEEYLNLQNNAAPLDENTDSDKIKPVYPKNFIDARFFDIQFSYNDEKFEPETGVNVKIELKDGLKNSKKAETSVVHFGKEIEEIVDVETEGNNKELKGFSFNQDSFSVDGLITSVEATETVKNQVTIKANGSGDDLKLDPPKASKRLDDNLDGTYKLSLNVSGTAKSNEQTNVTKSNVIIVLDQSTSMRFGEYQKVGTATNGVPDFTPEEDVDYYHIVGQYFDGNPRGETLQYVNGRFRARYSGNYTGDVYAFKTRLECEQEALQGLIHSLTALNQDKTVDGVSYRDIIEIEMIGFNHGAWIRGDGANKWSSDETTLLSRIPQDNDMDNLTHWWDALELARNEAAAKRASQPDEDVYVIFLTDGRPQTYPWISLGDYRGEALSLLNATDSNGKKYNHLYNIFTYGGLQTINPHYPGIAGDLWGQYPDSDELKRLTNYAYSNGTDNSTRDTEYTNKYFYDAKESDALANAFENIFSQITNSLAYGRVSITDGMTMDATATTIVDGKADGFTYTVKGPTGGELYRVTTSGNNDNPTVTFTAGGRNYSGVKETGPDNKTYYSANVNGTEYKMSLATINNDGRINWDLGGIGTLIDGYTYSCSFDVWPNQEAYDYVADLNNGLRDWDESKETEVENKDGSTKYWIGGAGPDYPSIVKYPNGKFSVLTNTDQKLTYSYVKTKTVNGTPTVEYDGPYPLELETPDPMELKTEMMKVVKKWDDSINAASQAESVKFKLKVDGKYYQKNGTSSDTFDPNTSWILEVTKENKDNKTDWIQWTEKFGIAPGLIKTFDDGSYEIKDIGHEYTVEEYEITGGNYANYNYEFSAPVLRPMFVGKILKYLVKVDDDHPIPEGAGTEVYTLKGIGQESNKDITYYALKLGENNDQGSLTAVNSKTSELDITKLISVDGKVVKSFNDNPLLDKETFTYKVTLSVPHDSDPCGITAHEYVPRLSDPYNGSSRIYIYGYQADDSGKTTFDYDTSRFDHKVYGRFNSQVYSLFATKGSDGTINWIAPEGPDGYHTVTVYMTLARNEVIRFANLPKGTKYTIQEVAANVGTANDGSNYPKPQTTIAKENNLTEEGYTISNVQTTNGTVSKTCVENDTITGEITSGNTRYYNQFTNDTPSIKIRLKKVADGKDGLAGSEEKLLQGAKFKLYSDKACTKQIVKDVTSKDIGSNGVLESGADGIANIGSLKAGTYYLKETETPDGYVKYEKPIEITLSDDSPYITYHQDGYSPSDSGTAVSFDEETKTVTFILNNSSGASLPSTGGPGTTKLYITGLLLILLSITTILVRKRIGEQIDQTTK